jgi:diaminohydroxyphosphoribosylaminopyrimidine deaminase/5-amino-6-(5-phosphoribosylamino)uracil reductase
MEDHIKYMRMALDLAEKARGKTWPNPMVGAVVVRDGRIISQGYHQRPGSKHAEAEALELAGNQARGSDLYVNLEPCCHSQKRTPPCTQAIIQAGIKKVIYAMDDPNSNVNGKGARELIEAGIEVVGKVMEKEAKGLNEVYSKYMTTGYPFTTLKMALSLDGRIAIQSGESRGLSSEDSLKLVHKMRLESEAIMVGSGTVIKDDPDLTVRLIDNPDNKQPTRFVIDSTLKCPTDSKIFDQTVAKTVVITTDKADSSKMTELEKKEIEIWNIRALPDGMVDVKELLRVMGLHEYCNLLVEGGSRLATSFLKAGLIDKFSFFFTPNIIGTEGLPPFGDLKITGIEGIFKLRDLKVQSVGNDILIEGYPK